jgi:hypothetical protein
MGTLTYGTSFNPTDNELLNHLKEKVDQTNLMSYPFIGAFIPMSFAFVRNRMPVSLRGGGGELGNLKP